MRPTKVLFIWQVKEELSEYLQKSLHDLPDIELVFPDNIEPENLISLANDCDIIIGWRPTIELLKASEKLSIFINPGAGAKHLIDMFREINTERPVTLVNGHGNAYFTAQHTVAMLMALTNKIVSHHKWMRDGHWRKGDVDAASIPLRDRKIGFLGYGSVNQLVHKFLSGFDNRYYILKTNWSGKDDPRLQYEKKLSTNELNSFLREINVLIIAMPHTTQTENLIGDKELKLLGKDALLVNVGRGVIINEESLFNALKDKTIAGAAIDVWYDYRPKPDEHERKYPYNYPFQELDNVLLSPHRAASPFGDLKRWNEVIENIRRFSSGSDDILNVVELKREY